MKTSRELKKQKEGMLRRKRRVRARIRGTKVRPRLSVFHSNKHTYAQLIDDIAGKTLIGFGDAKKGASSKIKLTKIKIAHEIGKKLAEAAVKKSIRRAVFDRSHYTYHGRTKAVADGAREGGLVF